MSRNVCVVTGTRAEYGLLRPVMEEIGARDGLRLQLVVTGMHLSAEFGMTVDRIVEDGFTIDRRVEMLLSSDTPAGIAKSMGVGMIGFADALAQLAPDLMVVLGDRFEIMAAVTAALVARIPVAHIHGGETTEGVIDESIRHSITKMSHLHFVAAEEYRRRVIQLGEQPDRVHTVGAVGVDGVHRVQLLSRSDLEKSIGFELGERNLLVTYHPVTLEEGTAAAQMGELLAALDGLRDTHVIFTMPNADTDGRVLMEMIEQFAADRPWARAYASLGQLRYLSLMKLVDGVVGNSSSGLIEAPALGKGTVDIGDRQRGRLRADSVLHCEPEREAISAAIAQLYDPAFADRVRVARNPYGQAGASARIADIIASTSLDGILKKRFFDLPAASGHR